MWEYPRFWQAELELAGYYFTENNYLSILQILVYAVGGEGALGSGGQGTAAVCELYKEWNEGRLSETHAPPIKPRYRGMNSRFKEFRLEVRKQI